MKRFLGSCLFVVCFVTVTITIGVEAICPENQYLQGKKCQTCTVCKNDQLTIRPCYLDVDTLCSSVSAEFSNTIGRLLNSPCGGGGGDSENDNVRSIDNQRRIKRDDRNRDETNYKRNRSKFNETANTRKTRTNDFVDDENLQYQLKQFFLNKFRKSPNKTDENSSSSSSNNNSSKKNGSIFKRNKMNYNDEINNNNKTNKSKSIKNRKSRQNDVENYTKISYEMLITNNTAANVVGKELNNITTDIQNLEITFGKPQTPYKNNKHIKKDLSMSSKAAEKPIIKMTTTRITEEDEEDYRSKGLIDGVEGTFYDSTSMMDDYQDDENRNDTANNDSANNMIDDGIIDNSSKTMNKLIALHKKIEENVKKLNNSTYANDNDNDVDEGDDDVDDDEEEDEELDEDEMMNDDEDEEYDNVDDDDNDDEYDYKDGKGNNISHFTDDNSSDDGVSSNNKEDNISSSSSSSSSGNNTADDDNIRDDIDEDDNDDDVVFDKNSEPREMMKITSIKNNLLLADKEDDTKTIFNNIKPASFYDDSNNDDGDDYNNKALDVLKKISKNKLKYRNEISNEDYYSINERVKILLNNVKTSSPKTPKKNSNYNNDNLNNKNNNNNNEELNKKFGRYRKFDGDRLYDTVNVLSSDKQDDKNVILLKTDYKGKNQLENRFLTNNSYITVQSFANVDNNGYLLTILSLAGACSLFFIIVGIYACVTRQNASSAYKIKPEKDIEDPFAKMNLMQSVGFIYDEPKDGKQYIGELKAGGKARTLKMPRDYIQIKQ